jgi:serine/threonine protein kinase
LLFDFQVPHHGFAADVWSFGVLAYICLSGCHPLDLTGEDDDSLIANRTRMGDVIPMTGKYWENVSEQARTFMCDAPLNINQARKSFFFLTVPVAFV